MSKPERKECLAIRIQQAMSGDKPSTPQEDLEKVNRAMLRAMLRGNIERKFHKPWFAPR